MRLVGVALLVFTPFAASYLSAQSLQPVGDEFQVNTYTTGYQTIPDVAMGSGRSFIVSWPSGSFNMPGPDGDSSGIQARRFGASGVAVGDEFQVNSYTTSGQYFPRLAMVQGGDFIVVWESRGSSGTDNSYRSVQGQLFEADGSPSGGEFQINSYTTGFQGYPEVAATPDGAFVVVWTSYGSASTDPGYSIQGQILDQDGAALGGEFQVNSYTTGYQGYSRVASFANGEFLVAWDSVGSYGNDNDRTSVQIRRFESNGTPMGNQSQVNTYTTGFQSDPQIAIGAGGEFTIVWTSGSTNQGSGLDGDQSGISGQRFDASGVAQGTEMQVNTYTTGNQWGAGVAVGSGGDFLVSWSSAHLVPTVPNVIQARLMSTGGSMIGDEFQVNSYTGGDQFNPVVSTDSDGNFVVVYQSNGSPDSDTSLWSIRGQRLGEVAIFADGFESGDTSAWSSTQ